MAGGSGATVMGAAQIRRAWADLLAAAHVNHVVHVGAHEGEEVGDYRRVGIARITLVEPIPDLAAALAGRFPEPDVRVHAVACSDRTGQATLHIPARTNMAGLLPTPGIATRAIRVPTRRLDELAPDADAAVIDVQGHELAVLAGAPWPSLRLLMVETCTITDRSLSPRYDTMTAYMGDRGWREVAQFPRDYDFIQRWAYKRATRTGARVLDVVYAPAGA